ncbi:MAG: hypothetical protein QFX33_02130 [Candidatus Nezhaarchaeota archaeon]|nr:hypothetical protein [Candidatus Nezhaarchaeota archaeon]
MRLAGVGLEHVLANFVFWSIIFAVIALLVKRRWGCLGLTISLGGVMFSAIVTLIGLLPWVEPTPFSSVPFPALIELPSIPTPATTCLIAAASCFTAAYFVERKINHRKEL